MSDLHDLKSTIKRGAVVTAANWPVVLIQLVAESSFKLMLAVPVIGGAALVALALGRDLGELLVGDVREIVTSIGAALLGHPRALVGFLASLAIVAVGGSVGMFLVKAGTVGTLVEGDEAAGAAEWPPTMTSLRKASRARIEVFTAHAVRLFARYLRLGIALFAVYGVSVGLYVAVVWWSYDAPDGGTLGWTVGAVAGSSVLIVWITIVNLVYLLLQMIVAVEDCGTRQAARHLARFLRRRFREVGLVFLLVFGFVLLATVASVLATTGLSLISFVPLVGLAVFPLQAAAWLVRGLVFQYLGLAALGSYVALYRGRVSAVRPADPAPALVRTAS
jgi:hypothetical protein